MGRRPAEGDGNSCGDGHPFLALNTLRPSFFFSLVQSFSETPCWRDPTAGLELAVADEALARLRVEMTTPLHYAA